VRISNVVWIYCLPCLPLAMGKASAKRNPFRDSPALEAVANFAAKLKCALDYGIEEKNTEGSESTKSCLSVVRRKKAMSRMPGKADERILQPCSLAYADPKRRLCLQCQTKTRGSWKCAVCHQRRSRHHFSYFISRRPSGKDGKQTCDTCHAAKMQHAVRKRAAASSIARLEPLRKRLRRRQIIQETWEAIAANKKARTHDHSTYPVEMRAADMASLPAKTQAEYVYTCPFCESVVTSPVATGQINHRRICGKKFRVENGFVRPTLHYVHTCPTCGSCIRSTKKSGRIQSKHKQANGRMCPRTEWQLR
jgi:hypothetical protein